MIFPLIGVVLNYNNCSRTIAFLRWNYYLLEKKKKLRLAYFNWHFRTRMIRFPNNFWVLVTGAIKCWNSCFLISSYINMEFGSCDIEKLILTHSWKSSKVQQGSESINSKSKWSIRNFKILRIVSKMNMQSYDI